MSFDYGNKKENGQYENYPTNTNGEYNEPIRYTYVHRKCRVATSISTSIAQTYAKNPKYYGSTFCTGCKEHFPVNQFEWDDGVTVGEFGPSEEERRVKRLFAEMTYCKAEIIKMNDKLALVEKELRENGWDNG